MLTAFVDCYRACSQIVVHGCPPRFLCKVFKVDTLSLDFGAQSGGQTGESLAIRAVMQLIYKGKEEAPAGAGTSFIDLLLL